MKPKYFISLCLIFVQSISFSQVVNAEEISEIRELVKELQRQIQVQDEKINAMQEIIKQLENDSLVQSSSTNDATNDATQEAVASTEKNKSVKNTTKVNTKGKLEIASDDGDYKLRVGGTIMLDGALYDNDLSELGSGTEARRARFFMKGKIFSDWNFKSEFGFEESEIDPKDVYIQYAGLDSTSITLGHVKEQFSLERLTSSKYITFMERALLIGSTPKRNIGIGIKTHGDNWTASAGVFGSGFDDRGDEYEGYSGTGRVTFAPLYEKTKAVHLGAAVSWRKPDEGKEIEFKNRPESHISGVKLVDTGDISNVDDFMLYGLEFASVLGPASLQGEYIWADISREGLNPDLDFSGWYAYASWFLTGESRVYKAKKGKFDRITPKGIVGKGGIGAWELGMRFSNLDLSDGDIDGGEESNMTVGLNWHLNSQLRFMLNYIRVLEVKGGSHDNDEPSVVQVRGQIDF
jgi:phosphate-selective porin OprO/OprP